MGVPPLLAGGFQLTVADESPATTLVIVGGPGVNEPVLLTPNHQLYATPLTVRFTTYFTPCTSGACGMRITPPRYFKLLVNVGLVASITQGGSATASPVKEWADPEVVMLPPISMNTGSPVGATYPGQACRGSGVSLPLKVVNGTTEPLPGK